jgi:hypothetical protein
MNGRSFCVEPMTEIPLDFKNKSEYAEKQKSEAERNSDGSSRQSNHPGSE